MKFCEECSEEIATKDSDNLCPSCDNDKRKDKRKSARQKREREAVLRDCGLVKVRGSLGGVYWE